MAVVECFGSLLTRSTAVSFPAGGTTQPLSKEHEYFKGPHCEIE
jgi:hypothetical protein